MRHSNSGHGGNRVDPIEAIPGIGIIRARTLRKAGFETVEALRRVSIDDLSAVPGITEIKARQILEYVESHRIPSEQVHNDRNRITLADDSAPAVTAPIAQSLATALREFSSEAAALLSSDRASQFSGRLARQLGKIAGLSGRLTKPIRVDVADEDQLRSDLRKLHKLLAEVSSSEKLGRKTQEKVTDRLRAARKEFETIIER